MKNIEKLVKDGFSVQDEISALKKKIAEAKKRKENILNSIRKEFSPSVLIYNTGDVEYVISCYDVFLKEDLVVICIYGLISRMTRKNIIVNELDQGEFDLVKDLLVQKIKERLDCKFEIISSSSLLCQDDDEDDYEDDEDYEDDNKE